MAWEDRPLPAVQRRLLAADADDRPLDAAPRPAGADDELPARFREAPAGDAIIPRRGTTRRGAGVRTRSAPRDQ